MSARTWEAVPDACKTVNFRHLLGRVTPRFFVYHYDHFVLRRKLPPYSLLRLVRHPAGADNVMAFRCPHITDGYAKGFIRFWFTKGGIICPLALLEIAIMIVFGRANTCRILGFEITPTLPSPLNVVFVSSGVGEGCKRDV